MATLMAIVSCSQDEMESGKDILRNANAYVSASFEQPAEVCTKTVVDENNKVLWKGGDAFGMFYSTGVAQFVADLAAEATAETADFGAIVEGGEEALTGTTYAVYPYTADMSISGQKVSMTLPAIFKASKASNGPMWAEASAWKNGLRFSHLAGLLRITITNLPTEATVLKVEADKAIAGAAEVDFSAAGSPLVKVADTGSKTITVTDITVTEATKEQTFYIPLPVGTYGTLSVGVYTNASATQPIYPAKTWSNVAVARANMRTASFGFVAVDASTSENKSLTDMIKESNTIPTTDPGMATTTTVSITGEVDASTSDKTNSKIEIPVTANANVTLDFTAVPKTTAPTQGNDGNALVIADAASGTSSTTAVNTVTVSMPSTSTEQQPNVTIDMPKTTVELTSTATSGSTTFVKVTATTAENTLVVNNNVTIKQLHIKAGNIRIKKGAKIETLSKDENVSEVLIYKESDVEEGALPTIPEGFRVVDASNNATLEEVLAKGGSYILTGDMDLKEPLVVKSGATVTLNLNGHKIYNTTDIWDNNEGVKHWSLISVQGGKLTITGEGQMVGKANDCFVVDVRNDGEVTIENGFFNGNISAVYVLLGKAYIKGGKFAVQQKDNKKGDAFLLNILDENRENSLIEVSGGTFVGVNPGDTSSENPNANFIKAGYHAEYAEESTSEVPAYKVVKDVFEGYKYVLTDEEAEAALVADGVELKIALAADVKVDIKPWQNKPIGTAATSSIVIEGHGHTLTFNNIDSDWNYVTCADAATTLTMNHIHLTNSGYNNGPWNRHDIVFNCPVTLNHVTSDKAIGLHRNGALTDVVIEDVYPTTGDEAYALWITAEGQTVTMEGCEIKVHSSKSGDRGIKIADEYVTEPALVNLTIKNTKFTTQKKAAVLVTSTAGARIALENVDISGVKADAANAVWVDSARAAYDDLVTVTGGTKIVES